jgi:hypothetical protein
VPIVELDFELRIGQGVDHRPIHFDRVIFRQRLDFIPCPAVVCRLSPGSTSTLVPS